MRSISLHWTAHDYEAVFPAYHFCLRGSSDVSIVQTCDLRANMRDVRLAADEDYAAHTFGRNSFSIGIAVCGMAGARPDDFGAFPLLDVQIDAMCAVAARLARFYGIPVAAIRTHAEAAVEDGYFGAAGAGERWDVARLAARPEPLTPAEALRTGSLLRARVAAFA